MSYKVSRRLNFDNFIVVWIIEHDDTENNLVNTELDRIRNSIKTFNDPNKCINYIQNAKNENIFLVIPSSIAQEITSQVHDLHQLNSIYIIDPTRPSKYEETNKSYTKLEGVFSNISSLGEHLQQNLRAAEETTTPISIISSTATSSDDLNTLDPSFMYSQLLKEILFELQYDQVARKRFIEFCQVQYADNAGELNIINQFEHDYENHSPAWWYTRECFLYKILNKALRTQNIDILCKMGFFIRDLHKQLEQLHSTALPNAIRILYRGQGMFTDEFKKLKKSIGGLLSFNNFLSTSTNRDVSLRFAKHSLDKDDLVAVLFEIQIDPAIRTVPFASLNGISYYPSENEILFSMHSIFRILDIEHMHNRIWNIQLKLTNDKDPKLHSLTNFIRNEIQGPNAIHRLGSFLLKVREWDKAKETFELILDNKLSKTKNELSYIEHCLGWIYDEKNDLEQALIHYQKSLDIDMTYLPKDNFQLAPTYANLACLYEKQGKFDLAMEHYRLALTIELKSPYPNQEKIASRYMNMGDLLRQLGRFEEARKSVKSALKIRLNILPSTHPDLGKTYGHLFDICLSMGDYVTALESAKAALIIKQKSYTANDFHIAVAHNNVSAALDKLGRYKEALEETEKAVKIGQYTYPLGSPEMRVFENSLNALRHKNN